MLSQLLLSETVVREDGTGEEMAIDIQILRLTLGITRIIAQESLEVSIWGSHDGEEWRPLFAFPQKFYCGTYYMVIDLRRHPDVRYLRAQWKLGRWNRDERAPLFGFYLKAEDGLLYQVGKVASDAF
ncbi:MAG: hypothetical protein JWO19_4780 [Bryobacterales bacterium]|nr:hypothetical protein [Bryobacterales bacterium]